MLILLLIVIGGYLLPGIVAIARKHHNAFAIFLLNLLLGWSFVGWVVALVWAFTKPASPQQIVVNVQQGHANPDD